MYAFGAMLSFTIAHISVTALRAKKGEGDEPPWHARPNFRFRGVDWPLFADRSAGSAPARRGSSSSCRMHRRATPGSAGSLVGFIFYVLYRRKLGAPLLETVRAPIVIMAGSLEYRNILVPIAPGYPSDEAMQVACRLAERAARDDRRRDRDRGAARAAARRLPAGACRGGERAARRGERHRRAYGVRVTERIVRARNAGRAIVDEATRRGSEIIVMGGPRRVRLASGKRAIFGDTVDFVLKHAPCRVMVAAVEGQPDSERRLYRRIAMLLAPRSPCSASGS